MKSNPAMWPAIADQLERRLGAQHAPHMTPITRETAAECVAALRVTRMPMERARDITSACAAHLFASMGIPQAGPAPSLKEYSLQELLEANHLVREDPGERDPETGSRTIQCSCDDRLVAALYVLHHYPVQNAAEHAVMPVASDEGAGVFVLRMPKEDEETTADVLLFPGLRESRHG